MIGTIEKIDSKEKIDLASGGEAASEIATHFYKEYRSLVYWTAYPLLKNVQDAEDLTQDIFLGLLRNNKFNPERGSIVNFLRTMTRCRAIDRLRAKGVRRRAQERLGPMVYHEATEVPLDLAAMAEQGEQVHRALLHLPNRLRIILELGYFGGLSQSQIAGHLKKPLGTIKSRVRKAKRELRILLSRTVE